MSEEKKDKDTGDAGERSPERTARAGPAAAHRSPWRRIRSWIPVFVTGIPVVLWTVGVGLQFWVGRTAGFRVTTPLVPVRADAVSILPPGPVQGDGAGGTPAGAGGDARGSDVPAWSPGEVLIVDMGSPGADRRSGLPGGPVRMLERALRGGGRGFVLVLADPAWADYRRACPSSLRFVVEGGGVVILVDHDQLPDGNILFSPLRRALEPVIRNTPWLRDRTIEARLGRGSAGRYTLLQVMRFLDLKADGRRLVVTGSPGSEEWRAMMFSASPVCAGVSVRDSVLARGAALVELQVARSCLLRGASDCFTSRDLMSVLRRVEGLLEEVDDVVLVRPPDRGETVFPGQFLTEGAAGERIDWILDAGTSGDMLDVWTSALADSGVLRRIRRAADRGAQIRILLPDSGRGDVNDVAAAGLTRRARLRRWNLRVGRIEGPAFQHTSVVRLRRVAAGGGFLIVAAADLTRKDLRDRNLTCAVYFENASVPDGVVAGRFDEYLPAEADGWISRDSGTGLLLREAAVWVESFLGVRRF